MGIGLCGAMIHEYRQAIIQNIQIDDSVPGKRCVSNYSLKLKYEEGRRPLICNDAQCQYLG